MKILHISDVHCSSSTLRELVRRETSDLIVVSGDLECSEAVEVLEEASKKVRVLAVPGNMDNPFISRMLESKGLNLDGKHVTIKEYVFAGVGGLNVKASIRMLEEDLEDVGRVDFLISHLPPKNTKVDKALGFIHAGSSEVRRFVEKWRPKAVFCGHIHESRGLDHVGETLIVNAGPLGVDGSYAVVDVETLNVEFKKL